MNNLISGCNALSDIAYYDVRNDLEKYPLAWCILGWSPRGPGKTYSCLRYMIEEKAIFLFIKRTKRDVELICQSGNEDISAEFSPFKPLNRDFGWNIGPAMIDKKASVGAFYERDPNDKPYGKPLGYIFALSGASDIQGFDLSEVDYIIFDEFIPKKHERISRGEGEALLEIYMTVQRDRRLRGRPDVKLLCMANAVSVNNPTFAMLDVTDVAVQMDITNTEYIYQEDRGILLHFIPPIDLPEDMEKSGIEKAMTGTAWGDMAFGGHFAFDDFTSVQHKRLKGYRPLCSYTYKKKEVYVYEKDGYYYACRAKANVTIHYNLARENEQKKFWYDYVRYFRDEVINDHFTFSEFTMYDLIINYKKIFDI